MKPVVLFVDDEPNLISGLKRATRQFRQNWDIHFASSGEEALRLIPEKQINTLVTDMRMPGIDGVQLLTAVSKDWPGLFRLVLSGEADDASTCQIVGRSHQFLTKPCDYDMLYHAIQQPFDCGDAFAHNAFTQNWSYYDRLIALPGNLTRLTTALNNEHPDISEVCAIIMSDPSLSVRVLQIVNSSYFGRPVKTANIAVAIKSLGVDIINATIAAGRMGKEQPIDAENHQNFAQSALLAREIAKDKGADKNMQAIAYTTALFAQLGTANAEDLAGNTPNDTATTSTLPVYLAALFGLPDTLIQALKYLVTTHTHTDSTQEIAEIAATGALNTILQKPDAIASTKQ